LSVGREAADQPEVGPEVWDFSEFIAVDDLQYVRTFPAHPKHTDQFSNSEQQNNSALRDFRVDIN
jgi:hypothetical protein